AKADLLIFGMGERPVWEVADRLRKGEPIAEIRDVRGTAHVMKKGSWEAIEASRYVGDGKTVILPSYEQVAADKQASAEMSRAFQFGTNRGNARPLPQPPGVEAVFFTPPAFPLETAFMDQLYDLPFARAAHPAYDADVPAFETVKHSVVTMR